MDIVLLWRGNWVKGDVPRRTFALPVWIPLYAVASQRVHSIQRPFTRLGGWAYFVSGISHIIRKYYVFKILLFKNVVLNMISYFFNDRIECSFILRQIGVSITYINPENVTRLL